MSTQVKELYVGIDVHSREHKAAIIPLRILNETGSIWQKVKPLSIKDNAGNFARLDAAIQSHVSGVRILVKSATCPLQTGRLSGLKRPPRKGLGEWHWVETV